MNRIETALEGVYIIEPRVFKDARGYFYESWNQKAFEEARLHYTWVQDNQSKSAYGTIRGIHYQKGEDAQTKLIQVLSGIILDVIVDLRNGSPTYGRYLAIELTADSHRQILIPKGFGHGFSVLSGTATILYKCDAYYAPHAEGVINAYDSQLAIDWQIDRGEALLSEKDLKAPSFAEYTQSPDFIYEKKRDS